jgi:hypothetical protein
MGEAAILLAPEPISNLRAEGGQEKPQDLEA